MQVKRGNKIDDNQEWIYVTLEVDGDVCEFTHVALIGLSDGELQSFAESRQDSYKFDILRDMYPKHPKIKNLGGMEQWIADGCWIDDETQADKVEWTNKHPVELDGFDRCKPSNDTVIAFDSATTVEQLKAVLRKMLIKQGPE